MGARSELEGLYHEHEGGAQLTPIGFRLCVKLFDIDYFCSFNYYSIVIFFVLLRFE